jgi:hypothetical protein
MGIVKAAQWRTVRRQVSEGWNRCRRIRLTAMDFLTWRGFNRVGEQFICAGGHTWAQSRGNDFSGVKSRGVFLMRNPIGMSVISVPDCR